MSRRSFPHIDPSALRDHADEERVGRVWDRIDHDLSSRPDRWGPNGFEAARARRPAFAYLAVAAAIGAFAVGLGVGKVAWDRRGPAEEPVAKPIIEKASVEVLAAGTLQRTFPLPGGGRLTLSPGATAELERAGEALTLRLLQGEASVDTTGAARKSLALVAGEARLDTKAGSVLSVKRNRDDLDVQVDDGAVSVSSPAGSQELHTGEHAGVPMHIAISSAPVHAAPQRVPILRPRRPANAAADPKAQKVPDWLARYNAEDTAGAIALLRKHGVDATIDGADSGLELMVIAELMRSKGNDPTAAVRAYKRVVDFFPGDQRASSAAAALEGIYLTSGDAELARHYHERANALAEETDALFCFQIKAELNKSEAARRAKVYLARYPNGQCHEDIEKMLQGGGDAPPGADPAAPASADPPAPAAP